MEQEKKKLLFGSYFRHISLCFYSNFDWESSLVVELNYSSNEYPLGYFWQAPLPQKQEIPKKCDDDVIITFFQVFLVFWVVGPIKSMLSGYSLDAEFLIPHPTSSPDRNLSKNTGRYVENTNKKSSFLLRQICQFNHYGWLILLKFYWFLNSNSQNLFLARFLIRIILDPKFPLMRRRISVIGKW